MSESTSIDGSTDQREAIALCAAKTVGLDQARTQTFIRTVSRMLELRPQPQASGTVMPLATGIRLRALRLLGPWLLVPVVCVVIVVMAPSLWVQLLFSAVIVLAFGFPLRLAQFWNWRRKLTDSMATLPAAGATIRAEADGLTVGETAISWADVRLDAVDLRYVPFPRIAPRCRLDQLRLATSKGPLLLDVHLIANGQDVVDTICCRIV